MEVKEQSEAERSLATIRAELGNLHRLAPDNLSGPQYAAILSLLPSAEQLSASTPQPATSATATLLTTLALLRRVLLATVFRLWWVIVYALALIGGTTVGFGLFVYLLTKLPWQTTFTEGQGWQRHSDGYYYWGRPQDSYTATVEATVRSDVPEVEGREL